MIPVKPALSYFRDCYRLDTRTVQLDNYFGRKVENRYLLEGKEQLLTAELPYMPLPKAIGEQYASVLSLYSKEKAIYYCSLFVVGYSISANGNRQRLCAPIFLHEAELIQDEDGHALKISPDNRIINVDVLSALKKTEEDVRSLISRKLPADQFNFGSIGKLKRLLTDSFNDLETEDLLLYPTLAKEAAIKKLFNRKDIQEGNYAVVPAAGFGFMKRSDNTQGIMTELGYMADNQVSLPPSIMSLFGYEPAKELPDTRLGFVPAALNTAQQKIIDNAHNHHLSVAIGPPGTGKSFTIASLAIEFMSRGQSVLIVSKTDQAVDVIDQKISKDLDIKNATVRAGKRGYLRELKERIENILSGISYYQDVEFFTQGEDKQADMRTAIVALENELKWARSRYEDVLAHEARWGEQLAKAQNGSLFSRLKTRYINWLTDQKEPHWFWTQNYMQAVMKRLHMIKEYVELTFEISVKRTLVRDRKTLKGLLNALRARTSSRREVLFDKLDFEALFQTLPIWLSKLSDLHQVLPMRKGLFDVVIIDEATQCDIASCLPAIYRAERAVIVGDFKQLRHVSFLAQSAQHALQLKYGLEQFSEVLDYRNLSILDLVDDSLKSQEQVAFLNEHYRSLPDLIRFSNQHFYQGGLKVMSVIPEDHSTQNIEHIPVKGKRVKQGYNPLEASAVINHLKALIEEEQSLQPGLCRNIGILSPFRDQVDYINKQLLTALTAAEIDKHDILCGTAHSFQGEERDVMLLSFCLDEQGHATGFNHINRPDVFNVSITRAKSAITVFTSFSINKMDRNAYLRRYLEMVEVEMKQPPKSTNEHDVFLKEVQGLCGAQQWETRVGYEVADLSLDLLVLRADGQLVAIDLIGYPGVFEEALSLSAYKVLHRAGVRTFPLAYTFWKLDREKCEQAVIAFVNEGLQP